MFSFFRTLAFFIKNIEMFFLPNAGYADPPPSDQVPAQGDRMAANLDGRKVLARLCQQAAQVYILLIRLGRKVLRFF
jgi:hypothetical protein